MSSSFKPAPGPRDGVRILTLDQELVLYRSMTKALARLVAAREEWIAYVIANGCCYCQNPFRAHIDRADDWAEFHLGCATQWPWRGDKPNPTKLPNPDIASEPVEPALELVRCDARAWDGKARCSLITEGHGPEHKRITPSGRVTHRWPVAEAETRPIGHSGGPNSP